MEQPSNLDFPVGNAQRLGETLHDDTHYSKLKIHFESLIPPGHGTQEASSFLAPLMRSIRTSKALRNILMWTDDKNFESSRNKLLVELNICLARSPDCHAVARGWAGTDHPKARPYTACSLHTMVTLQRVWR
jgi:hypothetical protein